MPDIWFWQRIVSPHMVGLAAALVRQGCRVTYVAEQSMSADRVALGWEVPEMSDVRLHFAIDNDSVRELVDAADPQSIHLCQGVRANGRVSFAQRRLAQRGLRQWIVMETVDDDGLKGVLKRLEYARLFHHWRRRVEGVLASGHRTSSWVVARGMPAKRVFPFAYFLPRIGEVTSIAAESPLRPFRFVYVGQFIALKRLDMLVRALSIVDDQQFELWVIGSGPLEEKLREQAQAALPGRVRWIGRKSSSEVPALIADMDCLVLPSRHDGWGAVVSEALMMGTPAICSDACGAAGVVRASGVGGVFPTNDESRLRELLEEAVQHGVVTASQRAATVAWGHALGGDAGAAYLMQIIEGHRPRPPWDVRAMEATS